MLQATTNMVKQISTLNTILCKMLSCRYKHGKIKDREPPQNYRNADKRVCPNTIWEKNPEDVFFDSSKNEKGQVTFSKLLQALETRGINASDPRLKFVMAELNKINKSASSAANLNLDKKTFQQVLAPNICLIRRALRNQFVIPDFQAFSKDIEVMFNDAKSNKTGKAANYIPELARINPEHWGISVCTIDGQQYSIGDSEVPFTIQSCSKPLTYALALETLGPDVVHKYVGTEPSGRNFNEIVLDQNYKPHNPMVNSGAILICSLLKVIDRPLLSVNEICEYVKSFLNRLAIGGIVGYNHSVYLSERGAADRNFALAFYMREHKCFPEKASLSDCMDFYFKSCSIEANCRTMAQIGATFANGGVNLITLEKVVSPDYVRNVLSLMLSCGMYDYSGQSAFKVGLPVKSGVAGSLLIVVPNLMGICTWCPALDTYGNSCRGIQFCDDLVKKFNFHTYDNILHSTNKKNPRRCQYECDGFPTYNLLTSAANGNLHLLKRYHLLGRKMSVADYDGRTALHLAAVEGHRDCVEFLLHTCNVPYDVKDRWGVKPIEEAESAGHTAIVKLMKKWQEKHKNKSVKK